MVASCTIASCFPYTQAKPRIWAISFSVCFANQSEGTERASPDPRDFGPTLSQQPCDAVVQIIGGNALPEGRRHEGLRKHLVLRNIPLRDTLPAASTKSVTCPTSPRTKPASIDPSRSFSWCKRKYASTFRFGSSMSPKRRSAPRFPTP
jgi:hypothetical protein